MGGGGSWYLFPLLIVVEDIKETIWFTWAAKKSLVADSSGLRAHQTNFQSFTLYLSDIQPSQESSIYTSGFLFSLCEHRRLQKGRASFTTINWTMNGAVEL